MSRRVIAGIADPAWREAHPLPPLGNGLDKEARGQVLLVAGSAFVPGAPRLTAEAALRVGAGKVQIATIEAHAAMLGLLMPEMATIGVPADNEGQIAAEAGAILQPRAEQCDALVIGCGMHERPQTAGLVAALLDGCRQDCAVVLDAGALTAMRGAEKLMKQCHRDVIMTPHHRELAALLGRNDAAIARDPPRAAREAARRFGATIVLKAAETFIATTSGELLGYASDSPGLGTAGSGDVLAGVIGGLLARGADPVTAAGWGVWLHGQAGLATAVRIGPLGFLASELLVELPALLAAQPQR